MARLSVFNFLSLNGCYKDSDNGINWHVHNDAEEAAFAAENAQRSGILVFGRVTFQMMESFWNTPAGREMNPGVAAGMTKSEKIVFSNSMKSSTWENTRFIGGDVAAEMKKLKETSDKDMSILGSGSLVAFFTEHGLMDGYQLLIDPLVLGQGVPLFNNITHNINLKLTSHRVFTRGSVLLNYDVVK
jgi:dihydrofolate reductase